MNQLQDIWQSLDQQNQASLLAFAEFLLTRQPAKPDITTETKEPSVDSHVIQVIPRPDKESVIAAVKRLSATYPMLDKTAMLNDTSDLVGQHIMQKRDVKEVIDELESIFKSAYDEWLGEGINK